MTLFKAYALAVFIPIILISTVIFFSTTEKNKKISFKHILISVVLGILNMVLTWVLVLLIAGVLNFAPAPVGIEALSPYLICFLVQLPLNWFIIKFCCSVWAFLEKMDTP